MPPPPPPPHTHTPPLPPVRRLVHNAQLQQTCPIPFDEGRLWKGEHSETLKAELQVGQRGRFSFGFAPVCSIVDTKKGAPQRRLAAVDAWPLPGLASPW